MSESVFKAYSLLTEKSFEDGDAVIRGMATTPTPDRVLDIVVPEGATFRSEDIKLHLYHDSRLPVGNVKFGKPTNKGIPFEARIPDVKEEGVVRDRINEARHSLKYNLISAVSIGFRALQDGIEIMKNGAYKFTKWEMLELSLTSVPANPEALITSAKDIRGGTLPRDVIAQIKAADGSRDGSIQLIHKPSGSIRLK